MASSQSPLGAPGGKDSKKDEKDTFLIIKKTKQRNKKTHTKKKGKTLPEDKYF